ncbi:Bud site selection protein bud4 [Maudiozyma exigua]|uniref:Bud site selection protein bud4 n=1 Tax=Maudiozyma exigua TaxID=34358 RepID=A0A9P6WCX7_MAUEX|nr:Bud site selection protein bud4 [Kazachstania exigua]
MADITVDEVVDSLVKEIDNELEYTISNSEQILLPLREKERFQIPLQDIGNDTMDMIVKYNTKSNGTKNDLNIKDPIEEDLELDLSGVQREDTVKEYTLADYDLSISSIGTTSTLNHNEAEKDNKLVSDSKLESEGVDNNADMSNSEKLDKVEKIECNEENLDTGIASIEQDKIQDSSDPNLLEHRTIEETIELEKEIIKSEAQEKEEDLEPPALPTIPIGLVDDEMLNQAVITSKGKKIEEVEENKVINRNFGEQKPEELIHEFENENSMTQSADPIGEIEEEPVVKPLSTIIGLNIINQDSEIKLPSAEDSFNTPDYVEINRSFGLPDVVYQEPIVMTTIFEDGTSTMTENSPPLNNTQPNDYLSIWRFQNSHNKTLSNNKRVTSPALSSRSKFSDATVATLVNSAHEQSIETSPKNSYFSFKPRLVSRSKVRYSSNSSNSSRVSSTGAKPLVIPQSSQPFSRISSSGVEGIYSNGEYAFMGEVVDASIDFTKDNPLDFTFNVNDDISKLNNSFVLAPETSLLKKITETNQMNKRDNSIENLEESLSTIIDFDKPNVLSNYLENELGTGFGDFLYTIDKENSANQKTKGKESNIIDLDSIIQTESVTSISEDETSELADETILFEHFEPSSPIKITETRRLVNSSHTQSPIKVVDRKDHKHPIQLISSESQDTPRFEYIEPFKEDSIIEADSFIENEKTNQNEPSDIEISKIGNVASPIIASYPLPDQGKLYISFGPFSFLDLEGIESHKAKFSIQCKMGDTILNTPYEKLTNNHLDISKDMVITLSEEFLNNEDNRLEILVKCNYEKVKTDLVPMKEKVQVGKKHLFRKTKYIYKTRYVQRSLESDRWDHLFGPNGEYCKGSHKLSKDELNALKFGKKSITISLKNKWAKGLNPYEVISLRIKISHISRTSREEILPSSLRVANQILQKYKKQQHITKCGYMVQDGGDLSGKIQRRYYELKGNVLTACHETSHKPQLLINLLNVKSIAGYGNYNEDDQRKFTNFTDMILLNECLQLIFDNGEVISFNVEGSEEEKLDWFMKLNEVIQLNVSHQPWVKQLLREEELKS